MNARELASLVPMAVLLEALGFTVRTGSRRCACILHGGSNPTAFSWTEDGLWQCFSCQLGGDRIALIRAARKSDYKSSVAYLAMLAGVSPLEPLPERPERAMTARRNRGAEALLEIERQAVLEARDHLHKLRALDRAVKERLGEIWAGSQQRWSGEVELAWEIMRFIPSALRRADAAYCIVALASPNERARFAVFPQRRNVMTSEALERGFVSDARGQRFEVTV